MFVRIITFTLLWLAKSSENSAKRQMRSGMMYLLDHLPICEKDARTQRAFFIWRVLCLHPVTLGR